MVATVFGNKPAAYANQQLLLVPEVTYGVSPVDNRRRISSLRLNPGPSFDIDSYWASGQTAVSTTILNDDFTEGDAEGRLDYNGSLYILCSLFGPPTIAETDTDSGIFEWEWFWDGVSPLEPISYTVDTGLTATNGADRVPGWLFNGMEISGGRGGFDLSASGFGKKMIQGVTAGALRVDPSGEIPAVPVSPLQGSIYLDQAWANLGTTQLLDIYDMSIGIADRLARTRPINASLTSDAVVETAEQEHTVGLTFGIDAIERARFDKIRIGQPEFVRVEFEGDVIPETTGPDNTYLLTFDQCLSWTETSAVEDTDSVATREWTGAYTRDSASGYAARIFARTGLPTL